MRQMEVKLPNHDEWALGSCAAVIMNIHVRLFCVHYFMMNVEKKSTGNFNHLDLNA